MKGYITALLVFTIAGSGVAKEIGKYKSGGGVRKIIQVEATCEGSCATANYDGKPQNAVWSNIRIISTDIVRKPNINQVPMDIKQEDLNAISNSLRGKAPTLRYKNMSFWTVFTCERNPNSTYCQNNKLPITAGQILTDRQFAGSLVSAIHSFLPNVLKYLKSAEDKAVFKLRIVGVDGKPVVFTAYWEGDNGIKVGGWRGGSGGNIPLKALGFQLENPSDKVGMTIQVEYYPLNNQVDLRVEDEPAFIVGSLPQPPSGQIQQDNYISPEVKETLTKYSGKYIVGVFDENGNMVERYEIDHNGAYDGNLERFISEEVLNILSTYNDIYSDRNGVHQVIVSFVDKKRLYTPDLNGYDMADFTTKYLNRTAYYKRIDKIRYETRCRTETITDANGNSSTYQVCDTYKCTTRGKPILYAYTNNINYKYGIRQQLILGLVQKNGDWSETDRKDLLQPTVYDYTYQKSINACMLNDTVLPSYLINFGDNKFCIVKPDYFVEDDGSSVIAQVSSLNKVIEYAGESENPDDLNPCSQMTEPEVQACLQENLPTTSGKWQADGSETCSIIDTTSTLQSVNCGQGYQLNQSTNQCEPVPVSSGGSSGSIPQLIPEFIDYGI